MWNRDDDYYVNQERHFESFAVLTLLVIAALPKQLTRLKNSIPWHTKLNSDKCTLTDTGDWINIFNLLCKFLLLKMNELVQNEVEDCKTLTKIQRILCVQKHSVVFPILEILVL